MTSPNPATTGDTADDGAALLERAIGYTRLSLQLVTDDDLVLPTPCRGWTLLDLLGHMDDSLAAFAEAGDLGQVGAPGAAASDPGRDEHEASAAERCVARLRSRACAVLAAWSTPDQPGWIRVGGLGLSPSLLARAGALEVAVHGWDVARCCGADRPLPSLLAEELLASATSLLGEADRPSRFAEPLVVPSGGAPGVRLLALLGRDARWAPGS